MIQLNKGILGFNLIYLYDRVELMHELLQKIEKLNIEAPVVGQTFAFEDLKGISWKYNYFLHSKRSMSFVDARKVSQKSEEKSKDA